MFCPRCSQEQLSEETKFCSRCGLPLGLISEVLENGGLLPQLSGSKKSKKSLTRRTGVIFSLFWFLIFVLLLTPIFGIIGVEELAAITALLGTVGALMMIIASFTVLKKAPKNLSDFNQTLPNYQANNLYQSQQTALPPQQNQPAQSYVSPAHSWRAPDTGEMTQPQSVTEFTTKLLKKEE